MSTLHGEQPTELSDYEKLREGNIRRNEAKLQALGLIKPVIKQLAKKKRAQSSSSTSAVFPKATRRSTRKRKLVSNYADEQISDVNNDGESSDYDETTAAYSDDDTLEENISENKRPRMISTKETVSKQKIISKVHYGAISTTSTTVGGVICEYAKSGRSTCRKCREKIEKYAPRIGMEAWIVGRKALTWQCPLCFLSNLTCTYDTSGRSRCHLSELAFVKGELKIGARSHTATLYYGVDAIHALLRAVILMIPLHGRSEIVRQIEDVTHIHGHDKLERKDQLRLQSVITSVLTDLGNTSEVSGTSPGGMKTYVTPVKDNCTRDKSSKTKTEARNSRRKVGNGKVKWTYGGKICYGTLIPSKETKTHCYAKTHKGNVKTLAKEKEYWSLLS